MADVFLLDGTLLDEANLVAPSAEEEMALMFEELAKEAREGKIENFVAVMMRSTVKYTVVSWRQDTLRIIGALEAAKIDLTLADAGGLEQTFDDLG